MADALRVTLELGSKGKRLVAKAQHKESRSAAPPASQLVCISSINCCT